MIVRRLLYLGCYIAMHYVVLATYWIIVGVKFFRRYDPWIDRDLYIKALAKAVDNMILPYWGRNKIINLIGEYIIEPVAWPITFINNIDNLYRDVMSEYEKLLNE